MLHAPQYSEDDYLALEDHSATKHEFVAGQILAMAGAREVHNVVAMNVAVALAGALRDTPCRALTSDQRVHVEATGSYFYPDVTVVCGPSRTAAKSDLAITNPALVVEVLSPATERFDRTAKLSHYERIETLCAVVLVDPRTRTVELHERGEAGAWATSSLSGETDVLELRAPAVRIELRELWRKLDQVAG